MAITTSPTYPVPAEEVTLSFTTTTAGTHGAVGAHVRAR